ncbi:uncharacterized protein LOC131655276 [Vicia villosa]|uniref:uncharacterized protein LOC131606983 n=1 Tax=Vicia villosa TaxID=3911 RepID=UPI00273CCCF0|nr:uncharacterized protein LOC131606983 [Vicia villosa]XP_058781152.1 uncharacterized protein LOC131655276 [Vicia villosa]
MEQENENEVKRNKRYVKMMPTHINDGIRQLFLCVSVGLWAAILVCVNNINIADSIKKNHIQVSNTKKPLFFYVNLAKNMITITPHFLSHVINELNDSVPTLPHLVANEKTIASPGRGILAMDESNTTCGKRLDSIELENTETNRQAWRKIIYEESVMT